MAETKSHPWKIRSLWLIGIVFCGVICAGGCTKVKITDEEVYQRIKSDLPPGSTRAQVNDFLKKQKWGQTFILTEFNNSDPPAHLLTEEEKRNIKWYDTCGIQQTEKSFLYEKDIFINFYYDKEEKLITYKLYSIRY
jgi:hypothetical protein